MHISELQACQLTTRSFNTFQKHSADSKLSATNTYLMSVAAVFQKLQVKVDSRSIETKLYTVQHSSQRFDIVYIWISKFNTTIATIY